MARVKVVHSGDACTIIFQGDKRKPEPTTAIIKFPGGFVEVARTSDGQYWAHINTDKGSNIVDSRIDYDYEKYAELVGNNQETIPPIPGEGSIKHMAIRIAKQP